MPFFKIFLFLLYAYSISLAQFYDGFDKENIEGWFAFTGDGHAKISLEQKNSFLRIFVDAREDKYNVWWAVTKRNIAAFMDLKKLKDPDFEIRVEARVRLASAPRRINMMVNTQRTTNFHKDLMEFDIPDTGRWHTISMTTHDLDAVDGDSLFVQLNVIDWGIGQYHVDVDYYRADIINIKNAPPDKGHQVPYHPPLPEISSFSHHLQVSHNAVINFDFPEVNFNNWQTTTMGKNIHVLTINARQWALLRWDFSAFDSSSISSSGILELTTFAVFSGGDYNKAFGEDLGMEFGKIRVVEIIDGDPLWEQDQITYNSFIAGKELYSVFNSQMVYDVAIDHKSGSKNYITISKPVLKRLVSGQTKGLMLRPLGAIDVSFHASGEQNDNGPRIHFTATSR